MGIVKLLFYLYNFISTAIFDSLAYLNFSIYSNYYKKEISTIMKKDNETGILYYNDKEYSKKIKKTDHNSNVIYIEGMIKSNFLAKNLVLTNYENKTAFFIYDYLIELIIAGKKENQKIEHKLFELYREAALGEKEVVMICSADSYLKMQGNF